MAENVTNALLAQLLMRPLQDRMPSWLQPYLTPPARPPRRFDDVFESIPNRPPSSAWFEPEQLHDGEAVVPPLVDRWLTLNPRYHPFRRRLEEFDAEYPRRPLRRR
jgi:hypothetical protein